MAHNSNSRRMRRARDAAANDEPLTGLELYDIQGDAAAALQDLKDCEDDSSLSTRYNRTVLEYVVHPDSSTQQLLDELVTLEEELKQQEPDVVVTARHQRQRNEWIARYNRGLISLAEGDLAAAQAAPLELLPDLIASKQAPVPELTWVASRLAFLYLECVLTVSAGVVHAPMSLLEQPDSAPIPVSDLLEWLQVLDETRSKKDPQLKFLLALYKSRLDVAELDDAGKHVDSQVRSARKELKSAMEVFQHKLRPSYGDAASVVSSANSEENSSYHHDVQPPQPTSVVLQKHNQAALNLKANLEQLKGNTKKSLILCSEALSATNVQDSYQVVHANNLGVVYETMHKRHLALHSLAKGLAASTDTEQDNRRTVCPDGTAQPDVTCQILHNAALASLQARNYLPAYECMASAVVSSTTFSKRPRCWLRMAEACIGVYSELKQQANDSSKFAAVQVGGEPKGIVVNNQFCTDSPKITREELAPILASPEDLEQVKRNPLLRARACLEHVMQCPPEQLGPDALMSARLTMSYLKLAFREFRGALEEAKLVLNESSEPGADAGEMAGRLHKRRLATACLYAAEASCALGETMEAMKFLVGDGKDDVFDRLASDLSGVTLETAASNTKGKRRLAKAQSMVRSSASAASAAMGNLTAAKQLAMSAQAMEDACSPNRERSAARRALVYSLLRGGNHGAALTILRSLR